MCCSRLTFRFFFVFILLLCQVSPVWAVEKPVIYFGVIPRYNPMIMYQNYQPIMDYLTEKASYHFELKLTRDYTEAVELLKTGAVQLASLGDVTFFEANRGFGAVPM